MPVEPGEQHLAVHVEDHPIEYAKFAGEIPKGNYGAGTVEIWDKGTYELVEEKRNGGLTVRLHGERLNGVWTLIPAHLDGKEENWLIVRKREEPSDTVSQGRRYRPMLATLERDVPHGEQWTFEVKWDGYRALAYIRSSEVQLLSRRDNDLTARFAGVAKEVAKAIKTPHAVVDGEVCALDERGRASFSAMQQGGTALVYYVFDVLEVEGVPLVDLTLRERRERLEKLLDRRNRCVRLSETFDDGDALYAAAEQQQLEGIMAKRLDSRYAEGRRTRDWIKVKTHGRQEFIIAGYTHGGGRRASTFGSLILAVREGDELRYVGNVGTGFDDAEIRRLLAKLKPLRRETSPFRPIPKLPRVRKDQIVWVEPQLVAEVEFAQWTHDGHLRSAVYQGLRDDKDAADVHREEPEEPEPEEAAPLEKQIRRGKRELVLSNLDKPFWPEEGIAKGDLLRYYRDIAPVLVPHLKDRPFTMKRYPDGWQGKFFFQKDAPVHMPEWIRGSARSCRLVRSRARRSGSTSRS